MFRSLAMFLRWKNAVFVTLEIWFSKDKLLSNITPRFLTVEEVTGHPSSCNCNPRDSVNCKNVTFKMFGHPNKQTGWRVMECRRAASRIPILWQSGHLTIRGNLSSSMPMVVSTLLEPLAFKPGVSNSFSLRATSTLWLPSKGQL